MEENQMPKKRNYERYLEGQNMNGESWTRDPFEQSTYQEPVYQQPSYNEPTYTNSFEEQYSQPSVPQNYAGLEEPVTKGEWAICFFLMMIPCVGFIMMFVWAFSKSEKKSKSNFFKVQLIFVAIILALYFLFFLFAICLGIVAGGTF